MKVKLCGMMTEEDVSFCVCAGADALGFVVEYPAEVPWNLSVSDAARLMAAVPQEVMTVLVTGGTSDHIIDLATRLRPDAVQLHHKESLSDVAAISAALKPLGICVIKALGIRETGQAMFEISDPVQAADALQAGGLDALLIDACTAEAGGGTGTCVDRKLYAQIQAHTGLPVIVAGGLTAGNLQSILSDIPAPDMVDVLSGVERTPGRKDYEKVLAFLHAAKTGQEDKT